MKNVISKYPLQETSTGSYPKIGSTKVSHLGYSNISYCKPSEVRTVVNKALQVINGDPTVPPYFPKYSKDSYRVDHGEGDCRISLTFQKELLTKTSKKTRWNVYDMYQDTSNKKGVKLTTDKTFDKEEVIEALVKLQSNKPVVVKPMGAPTANTTTEAPAPPKDGQCREYNCPGDTGMPGGSPFKSEFKTRRTN